MKQLPRLVTNKFGDYVDMNAATRKRHASNITYQDDKRYNDHEGALWLNVKHKDFHTIAAAVLTGMYDTGRLQQHSNVDIDEIVASEDSIDTYLENNKHAKSLVNATWNFLKQYMSKGTVTVYRGLELTDKVKTLLQSDPYILYNPARIIQYVDNTTKEFNSFSVSKVVASGFATQCQEHILFSAEVDNNDINWAFTAYLDGRHGGIGEYELNINNLKRLKNVKLIEYSANSIQKLLKLQRIQQKLVKIRDNFAKLNNIKDTSHLAIYAVDENTLNSKYYKINPDITKQDSKFYICTADGHIISNKSFDSIYVFSSDTQDILLVVNNNRQNLYDATTDELLLPPEYNYRDIVQMQHSKTRVLVKYYENNSIKANVYDLALKRMLFTEDLQSISTEGIYNNILLYKAELRDIVPGENRVIFLNGKTHKRIFKDAYGTRSMYIKNGLFSLQLKDRARKYLLGFVNGKVLTAFEFDEIKHAVTNNHDETTLVKLKRNDEVNYFNTISKSFVLPSFVDEQRIVSIEKDSINVLAEDSEQDVETYNY